MSTEKLGYYALIAVGIVAGGIILFVFAEYVLPVILPFLLAWLIAMATRSPAAALSKKISVPACILRLLMSIIMSILTFGGAGVIVWRLTVALGRFLTDLGEGNRLYELLNLLTAPRLPIFGDGMSEELAQGISDAFSSMLSSALTALGGAVTAAIGAVPKIFLFAVVTLISLVYFSIDLERINGFVKGILPESISSWLSRLREGIFFVIKKYIRSYFIIMLITYSVMLIGLASLRVDHAPLIALAVAFLDILPILGVGTVLVPWSIIELSLGNRFLGIGLLILFVINAVIRQLAEPKIVGKSLDMHPIATLIMLYVGYSLFGIVGLFAFPVLAVSLGVALKKDNAAKIG